MKVISLLFSLYFLFACQLDDTKSSSLSNVIGTPGVKPTDPTAPSDPTPRIPKEGDTFPFACDEKNILAPLGFNDEFAGCLWHIVNREQRIKKLPDDVYYTNNGTSGSDLRLTSYALEKYSGQGVNIHIVDDGLPIKHPDFQANFDLTHSKDCSEFGKPPVAKEGDHGTKVAGIIGAVGKNKIGVSGIAYESKVSGYNAFGCENFTFAPLARGSHIWNGSYGILSCDAHRSENRMLEGAFTTGGTVQRIFYVKATSNSRIPSKTCAGYDDPNRDPANISPYVFNIAAVDNQLKHVEYSAGSAAIFMAGISGYSNLTESSSICTLSGNDSYTCAFAGTSAAAPTISGVAALIKQANPFLGPLDIAYILAKTARPVKEAQVTSKYVHKAIQIPNKTYLNFSKNSAGYQHSFNTGFGVPDADAAVRLAESYPEVLPNLRQYWQVHGLDFIPGSDNSKVNIEPLSCERKSVTLEKDFKVFLNRVSLKLEGKIKNAIVFLHLPDGTTSQLARDNAILADRYDHSQKFKTFAGFAINARGTWELEVCNNGDSPLKLADVKLETWGYKDMTLLE